LITLGFHGAAGTVTGSKYLLTVNNKRVLVDCGMLQGPRDLRQRNWTPPPFDAREVSNVILTHSHIDHIGYLPVLVRRGFKGEVFATPPTVEMAKVLLADAAYLQEEDAEYRNRKKVTRHKKALPLFDSRDAERVNDMFHEAVFNEWTDLGSGIRFRYHVAGHILGAAHVEIEADDGEKKRSILFSGDVGRYAVPLVNDPAKPPKTDYLVCESTYGGEVHQPQDIFFDFANLIDDIMKRKSVLLIPSFAVGRTQQIVYIINVLIKQGRIPPINIHIDSPMAIRATKIYQQFKGYHQLNHDLHADITEVFNDGNVSLHLDREESKALNKLKGPAVIISASGMMTGGRIMHHLLNRLSDPNTTLSLVGFMAAGTTGRKIVDGADLVYIHKHPVEVRAKVIKMFGLSGHADGYELMHWMEPLADNPPDIFLTHGEPDRTRALADDLKRERGWDCRIPKLDEIVEL